ncbi:hypothetical protein BB560_000851 [Smittium megazygosporum]|uniref:Uncharacterized protein n=1 Tax=Smittium megazygosporum TaxID=133381 RepID=A0A2T9ZJ91_9FUNG|nr:hypothetical protein BB560_000851 [Smittium megazygosporum]
MSTTDPSAAKPDGFAIGSISKRDRSGSGDEAAPVYPVKHPTMSYAGAAKGRPAAQIFLDVEPMMSVSDLMGLDRSGAYLFVLISRLTLILNPTLKYFDRSGS